MMNMFYARHRHAKKAEAEEVNEMIQKADKPSLILLFDEPADE